MKPNQIEIRANPVDGEIWLYKRQHGKPTRAVGVITDQVMLALCADMTAVDMTERVERSVRFADGMECKITVEMIR